jgi:hypothetical protein
MSTTTTLNAEKGKPYFLAFFFAPNLSVEVTAEVQRVENGAKSSKTLPHNPTLSTNETWVYSDYHTFTNVGWHIVHYRANKSSDGEIVGSDIRRILVRDPETENAPTELKREIQEGKKVTSFDTIWMNNRGTLAFKTRTR